MCEAVRQMSFFYEEEAGVVERSAVVGVGSVISRTEAAPGWARPAVGQQPSLFRGYSVGPAHWSPVARSAGRISRWLDLLATATEVGRARRLAAGVA